MKMVLALLIASLSSVSVFAAESYQCLRIVKEGVGVFRSDPDDRVELFIDADEIRSVVYSRAADKPISYIDCKPVSPEDSEFAQWFYRECRHFESTDGRSYTVEAFLKGSYAGISPLIAPDYSVYDRIQEVAESAAVEMPARTFVIFAQGNPLFEYYCYANEFLPAKSPLPAEKTSADVAPADVVPADVVPADVAPADVAPADVAPPSKKPNVIADDPTQLPPTREEQE